MLKIYQSNQKKILLKKICKKIASNQKKKNLNHETFLINNSLIQEWFKIYIAKKQNIHINIKYKNILTFFINLIKPKKNTISLFKTEHLKWLLMSIIHDRYNCFFLKKLGILYKNFEFCSNLSDIFIQYIFLKPHLILKWEKEKQTNNSNNLYNWQKKLWKLIIKKIKFLKQKNFTEIIDKFLKKTKKSYFLTMIPQKIFIYSDKNIEPLITFIINMIQDKTSIYLFQYQLKKKKNNKIQNNKISFLKTKKSKKILYFLQQDLLKKNFYYIHSKKKFNIHDKSLVIHKCASRLQEIQILHQYLINMFNTNKNILPHHILITAFDLNSYQIYLKKIFNSKLENNPFIYQENKDDKIKKNFLFTIKKILNINNNRFQSSWILSLLDNKFLRRKFNIKSKNIPYLHKLIKNLNIKFGFNKKHFTQMSLPNINLHSWEYAINRITSGFLFKKKNSIWNHLYVYNVLNNKENILLGNFIHFIIQLNKIRKKIFNKRFLKNWLNIISKIIKNFFQIPIEYKKFFFILNNIWIKIILQGIHANFSKKISINFLLEEFLKHSFSLFKKNQFMSGNINIINLNKSTIIPFKIICILGCTEINYQDFEKKNIFNILKKHDYQNNQNIFFETILSTKKNLFCSYTKNIDKIKKNSSNQYIKDILSYIKNNFYISNKQLIQEKKKPNILNYIYINNINKSKIFFLKKKKQTFFKKENIKMNHVVKNNIQIKKLINFWKNPIDYFFKKKLNINIKNYFIDEQTEDEPFFINTLDKYYLKKKLLKYHTLKKSTQEIFQKYKLKNKLPYKNIGKILWKQEEKKIHFLSKQINRIKNSPKTIHVHLKINKYTVYGKIKEINTYGLIRWNVSTIKYSHIISVWIEHIISCILKKSKPSILLGIDKSCIIFKKIKKKKAKKYLKKYVQGYLDGNKKPLLILKSGINWLQSIFFKKKNIIKNDDHSLKIAKKNFFKIWNGNSFSIGEKNHLGIKKIIPSINDKIVKKICNTCTHWLLPLFKNTTIKKTHVV